MDRENDSLRKWLVFSKSEKRGIILLLIVIVLLIAIRILQKNYYKNEYRITTNQQESQDTASHNSYGDDTRLSDNLADVSTHGFVAIGEQFDPNKAKLEDLLDQNIPAHIANRIINYRLKGGVFYYPSDLYRIYGIDSNLVVELIPWMVINAAQASEQKFTPANALSSPKPRIQLEINSADSAAFCKLPGIGPVLSRRIIKYRNILGGFYSLEQLNEVYGISDSLLSTFSQDLLIDTSLITRIALNSASYYQLKRHPYLNNNEVKAILSYRRLIGPFTAYKELSENHIISENTYRKMRLYLSLN